MNIAARLGLVAAGAAVGGGAMYAMHASVAKVWENRQQDIAARSDTAQAEWDAFRNEAETQFPGLELNSREDHARFDAFLKQHPAPSWITVQHEGYTRAHLSTHGFLPSGLQRPIGEEVAYPVGFGGMFALGGAGYAIMELARPSAKTLAGKIGATAGAAAIAALGVGMVLGGLQVGKFKETAYAHSDTIVAGVNVYR